ncbi:MAG: hypothetical protein UT43_C0001G0021 [Parcubacteria group bacterium GW2011_GWC1_39_29]|uniref:Uncharacterized protein n=1 Tax=Candidatus Yanofskybacteria bacterium GW2011_GWD1_39_16 TaxID=1619030 RepID=A0A837HUN1_9BACT|nr:MAG: hypothetical protein UT35_C0004G0014 [Candidatus Yanofskybacteria bacterium GW2011_GWD1_39_16]KKR15398.1 MAG: hypothetical protein UT43_C0001G0021 [Parcubacteria group bacterium GW2011_GWC1_39_29]
MPSPILHLNPDNWLQGKATGQNVSDGLWTQADGINPYVNNTENSSALGLLQTGAAATDISGEVVDQKIQKFIILSSTSIYGLGYNGDIYSIDSDVPTLADSGTGARTLTSLVNGFISSAGGTLYLYYIHRNGIGRWNLASTWADSWNTALTAQDVHPVHFWEGNWWIGNQIAVAKFDSSAAITASAFSPSARTLVTAISDDGYHLVVGTSDISSKPAGGFGNARIYFWVGAGSQWQQEWELPEPFIQNIYNLAGQLYAIAGKAIYTFNVSTPPRKILDLDSTHTTPFNSSSNHPQCNVTDRLGDAMIWGGVGYYISSFGKINSRTPSAYLTPLMLPSAATSIESLIVQQASKKIYVGTNNSKLYTIDLTVGGNISPNPVALSRWIDLKGTYNLTNLTFDFGFILASGDVLDVVITNQKNQTFTESVSFAKYGATYEVKLPTPLNDTKRIKIQMTWSGGNVRIYSLDLWGDKTISL